MRDPAAAGHGHQEAGQASRVDVLGEVPVQAVQRLGVQSRLRRLHILSQLSHRSPPVASSPMRPDSRAGPHPPLIVAQDRWSGGVHQGCV